MRIYFGLGTQGRGVNANGFPPRLRVKENRSFPEALAFVANLPIADNPRTSLFVNRKAPTDVHKHED